MDAVHKPDHYQRGGIETIDVIRAKLGTEGFGFYCEGNVLKYLTRWRDKGGLEDLRKAQVYLGWMVEAVELNVPETSHGTAGWIVGQAIAGYFDPSATEAGSDLPPATEARIEREIAAEDVIDAINFDKS